jgi:hypothetical protein
MKKSPRFRIGFAALTLAAVIAMGGCTTFQSIALTPPDQTVFGQGEGFSSAGLQITGTTKKGEAQDLSGNSKLKVTGYNPDRTGEQTITVDYRGVTAAYTVTVVGVESIAVEQSPAVPNRAWTLTGRLCASRRPTGISFRPAG